MNQKLIITSLPVHGVPCIITALAEEGRIVELQIQKSQDTNRILPGNIYIGKVQKIAANIRAAFIYIQPGYSCYYSLDDNPHPFFTSRKNDQVLKAGDELLVQVRTESVKMKLPTVTSNLNLSGKYLVLTTAKKGIGLSAKLSKEEKTRLKEWLLPHMENHWGVIIRTNARTVDKEVLLQELHDLSVRIAEIYHKGKTRSCYSVVERANPEYLLALRNLNSQNLTEIVTDTSTIYQQIGEYLAVYQQEDRSKLRMYEDVMLPLYKLYSIETLLTQVSQEKIWLKSGGFLMIQQTEAFAAIDVNTGKYQSKKKASETYRKINLEAAGEIAIQLRLRNLSGIILIDFINMDQKEDQDELLIVLQKHLQKDFVKAVVVDITPLHIVEVTRQKIRKSLPEQLAGLT